MSFVFAQYKNEWKDTKIWQSIDLNLVNVDQVVVSNKFKHSDDGFKYFIGYKKGEIVKPLCIVLPQMGGYIKYFENGGKNISFLTKDDMCMDKYHEIWDKIKGKLNRKFHSMAAYDEKYIKAKVTEFDGVIKTNFLDNEVPKENEHYTCISCITIDSFMRIEKKNYPQVYLEKCKYRMKKTTMIKFIITELESKSQSESESDIKVELKSESEPDTE